MIKAKNSKRYDLEERTLRFAMDIRNFTKEIPKTITNNEYLRQLIRSSASVGANYIEANESMSKKDFAMRIKICRKEAKESIYWLLLLELGNNIENKREKYIDEATQLMMIFGSILQKSV